MLLALVNEIDLIAALKNALDFITKFLTIQIRPICAKDED